MSFGAMHELQGMLPNPFVYGSRVDWDTRLV
jgi:hypothetical protein